MAMDKVGVLGALVKMDGVSSGDCSTLVYFSCVDCAVEGPRAVKAGGSMQQTKMSIGEYGFFFLIIDTDGDTIGLHSME